MVLQGGHGHPTTLNGKVLPSIAASGSLPLKLSRALVSGAGLTQGHGAYAAAAVELVNSCRTASFTLNAYTYGLVALGAVEVAAEAPDAEAYDICAVIPVIEAAGGCVVHSGHFASADTTATAGAPFVQIDLSDPKRKYSSIVCAGRADEPLCAAAVAIMSPRQQRGASASL